MLIARCSPVVKLCHFSPAMIYNSAINYELMCISVRKFFSRRRKMQVSACPYFTSPEHRDGFRSNLAWECNSGMIECSSEAPLAVVGSPSPYRLHQRSQSVSHNAEVGRALQAFAKLLRRSNPKMKAWPSMLGVGHETDSLVLVKKRTFRSPKKVAGKDLVKERRIFYVEWDWIRR